MSAKSVNQGTFYLQHNPSNFTFVLLFLLLSWSTHLLDLFINFFCISVIPCFSARTCGDGMENDLIAKPSTPETVPDAVNFEKRRFSGSDKSAQHHHPLLYKAVTAVQSSSPPAVKPVGKIFNLIPRLVHSNTSSPNRTSASVRNKEPRFIPFEPYKAAINPIIPYKKPQNKIKLKNRNNLDLNVLVTQMSQMTSSELGSATTLEAALDDLDERAKEQKEHERELAEVKKERDYYANQLKFQVQVNTELKNLLVASIGEDLQTRVNVLTEDKLQLARALLNTAENLSSHTEQIEYLIGQSEVWRSKFLASSLMVEELARWKASLTQRNNILLTSNKNLLDTCAKVREMQTEVLKNLVFLANLKTVTLPSSNLLDLTAESQQISQHLILHAGVGMPNTLNLTNLDPMTTAEKQAIDALQNSNQPLMSTDDAFRAIIGQAFPSILSMQQQRDQQANAEVKHEGE
jgi:hypothetical protein